LRPEPRITVAREGYPLVGGAVGAGALALALAAISPSWASAALLALAIALLVAALFLLNFFRDPRRTPPSEEGAVVSPADGKVILVEPEVEESRFLRKRAAKVSIFMSPIDVHVNRAPVAGVVTGVHYNPGKFLAAFSEKASLDNEQNAIVVRADDGRDVLFIQIAGLVARRIVCRVRPGDRVERGQRVGMIKLGSRVDIFLTGRVTLRVKPGDRVTAGTSVLGVLT